MQIFFKYSQVMSYSFFVFIYLFEIFKNMRTNPAQLIMALSTLRKKTYLNI